MPRKGAKGVFGKLRGVSYTVISAERVHGILRGVYYTI